MSVTRRSVLWLPLLVVGSLLFWTAALGLGSLSLTLLTPDPELEIVAPVERDDAIMVRLVDEPPPPPEQTDRIGRTAY
jgi:hypothetical protein